MTRLHNAVIVAALLLTYVVGSLLDDAAEEEPQGLSEAVAETAAPGAAQDTPAPTIDEESDAPPGAEDCAWQEADDE